MGNLGLSHITYAPGYTTETHPGGPATFTEDEWIDVVYKRYTFWVLQRVEHLISDPNAGFSILLMLYPYFQMYIRHKKGFGETDKSRLEFTKGIEAVFEPELKGKSKLIRKGVAHWLYIHMRCELAHGNLTGKGVALSDDNKPALWWDVDENAQVCAVGVNPRLWFERICEHFETYISELQVPANVTERENFLKYATKYYR